jgi:hypothetical protein
MAEHMSEHDGPRWDDDVADAVALVAAVRADDVEAVAMLLPNVSLAGVAVTLARLLAVAADEGSATPGHFRAWAAQAATRRGSDSA